MSDIEMKHFSQVVEKFEHEQQLLRDRHISSGEVDNNHNAWSKRQLESPTNSTSTDEPRSEASLINRPMSLHVNLQLYPYIRKTE